MRDLNCFIHDLDGFSNKLLIQYIEDAPNLSLSEGLNENVNILFIDADQIEFNSFLDTYPQVNIMIVSSNEKHIHALFKDQVAGYLSKSELTYSRFLEAVEEIRMKIAS